MNQYERQHAIMCIDGYFSPQPNERGTHREFEAIERARAECLSHMRNRIAHIEAITIAAFYAETKRKMPAAPEPS